MCSLLFRLKNPDMSASPSPPPLPPSKFLRLIDIYIEKSSNFQCNAFNSAVLNLMYLAFATFACWDHQDRIWREICASIHLSCVILYKYYNANIQSVKQTNKQANTMARKCSIDSTSQGQSAAHV